MTLSLGYFFIFVWAPHPWSWQGIDAYHELAKSLARGEPFQTTDVPWGYAYYAALLYRLFGEHLWLPLVLQATLNAFVPWLLFRLVAPLAGRRVAALSALIVGVFSFNTVYASTQSSDAICTALFLAGLLLLARGFRGNRFWAFAAAGVLFGLVPQFRPNLVLLPGAIIAVALLVRPRLYTLSRIAVFAAVVVGMQVPWIARNYRLTGLFLPTSTHGGVQLWYGTLQVGPYLESRAHNPRFYFASPAFSYTSMSHRSIVISAVTRECIPGMVAPAAMHYWTDRDPQRRRVDPVPHPILSNVYEVPAQPANTVLYYFFIQETPTATFLTPRGGADDPFVAFISNDHLGDLDVHDDVLDMFDLVRMVRHVAWQEPLRAAAKLDLTRDGTVDGADVNAYVELAAPEMLTNRPLPAARIEATPDRATLHLADGSWIAVARQWRGRQTDIDLSLHGQLAPALLSRTRTFTSLTARGGSGCPAVADVAFNAPFYLGEPHGMQRYMALAFDNIERDPAAFVRASLYRAVRLFVVRGSGDLSTTQQFRWSSLVYAAGTALSIAYLGLFAAGVIVAHRRYRPLLLLLVPIVYVPVTICFVLTNMRYTVTVQPLMFAFVAAAVAGALRLDEPTTGRYSPR